MSGPRNTQSGITMDIMNGASLLKKFESREDLNMSDITRDWSFGGQLRRYRIQREITLRDMCKKVGVDMGNYSKMERGELPPPKNTDELAKIIKPLRLDEASERLIYCAAYSFHCGRLFERFWKTNVILFRRGLERSTPGRKRRKKS